MAISFKKYIDITSGVGGGAAVRDRDLITRIYTSNNLVPPNTIIEMDNIEDVADYFGSKSEEYARAAFYFGWISKNITKANKISFARHVAADSLPMIYGKKGRYTLSTFQAISTGQMSLTLGDTKNLTGLDFTTATSLSDVANAVKSAINLQAGEVWTGAQVVFDAVNGRFMLVGGKEGDIKVSASGQVADLLGWGTGAIYSDGALSSSAVDTLINTTDISNNFASFLFMDTLSDESMLDVAEWNKTQNVMYMYLVRANADNAETLSAALIGYSGTVLTLAPDANEYDEMIPGIILAATNYSKINSVQNYMYQQFPTLTPKVNTTPLSNFYDNLRVNYYGQTQTAGQNISFYQRGSMMGGSQDLVDQNIYGNEIWLKDTVAAQIMSLFLSLSRISANNTGRSQLLAVLQGKINKALDNGVISVGKTLNDTQKLFIEQTTGDDKAYLQIQNIGYWVDCEMQTIVTQDGRTEYKAVYTLIYSKDDAIRKVEGTHTLI